MLAHFKNPAHGQLKTFGFIAGATILSLNAMAGLASAQPRLAQSSGFFSNPPVVSRVYAPQTGGYVSSTYEFTVVVPADAGQPLKAIRISQLPNLETIQFDLRHSKAYRGTKLNRASEIPLMSIGGTADEPAGEATIVFEQPVQPGSVVTLALQVDANPQIAGVYQFGVTAFPVGENSNGQFLGVERINFYNNLH
jgi:Protein of unknown function (DUF2808)